MNNRQSSLTSYSESPPRPNAGAWADAPPGGSPAFLKPLMLVLGFAACGYFALALYERLFLGLPVVREEPALFTTYYLARSAFALLVSGLVVWILNCGRSSRSSIDRVELGPRQLMIALLVMAAALLCTGVFLLSPTLFGELAKEDRPLEWASACFLFAGSGLFAAQFLSRLRVLRRDDLISTAGVALAAGFAILFFLIGMEEISWMQRIVGFETPSDVAKVNWQGEFNLHNMHTDLSETVYYFGAGLFLMLLPFLREAAPEWRLLRPFSDFIPVRGVAAVSAPVAIFNYGHWNLVPVQVTVFVTLFVLLAYAVAAARRKSNGEALMFFMLASSVAAGQTMFLAYGQFMPAIPNATEFKEFFIALGLLSFAVGAFMKTQSAAQMMSLDQRERGFATKPFSSDLRD